MFTLLELIITPKPSILDSLAPPGSGVLPKETWAMIEIFQVETNEHRQHVRVLYLEYIKYVVEMFGEKFGVNFEVEPIVERDMNELHKLSPPQGSLLLGQIRGQIVGLGGLRQIGKSTGEIKRMYIRPNFQGNGVGRTLLDTLIAEAREIGYRNLRLDVGPYANSAESLYRSAGFSSIAPYPESEVPSEFHSQWQFMELPLP